MHDLVRCPHVLDLPPSAISSFTNLSASAPKPPDDSTAKATQVAPILSASKGFERVLEQAEREKHRTYDRLAESIGATCVAFAVESSGGFGAEALKFGKDARVRIRLDDRLVKENREMKFELHCAAGGLRTENSANST